MLNKIQDEAIKYRNVTIYYSHIVNDAWAWEYRAEVLTPTSVGTTSAHGSATTKQDAIKSAEESIDALF